MLTYTNSSTSPGKTTPGTDVVESRFIELVPGVRVVQAVDFISDDPSYGGRMTIRWELTAVAGGTRVEITAGNVPVGIDAAEHAAGLASSLENLANYLEG